MSVSGKVMWAELQNELGGTGLNVSVGIPSGQGPWAGTIDELPFLMTIPPRNENDGYRDFLVVSLFGQDEERAVEGLTKFMGYSPFCKYQNKLIDEAAAIKDWKVTGTYEWDKNDPRGRLEELAKDKNVYGVKEIKAGLQAVDTSKTDMAEVYQEFTPEIVAKLEKIVEKNQNAEWSHNKLSEILPFIKAAMPRIGRNQSLFGLSIISLDRSYSDEEIVIKYGLEPLAKAGILTEAEAGQIMGWYKQTTPTWDSNNSRRFEKTFEVGGQTYKLITDCYRGCRDLILQVMRK